MRQPGGWAQAENPARDSLSCRSLRIVPLENFEVRHGRPTGLDGTPSPALGPGRPAREARARTPLTRTTLSAPIVLAHGLFGFERLGLGRFTWACYFRGIPEFLQSLGNRVL